jgi:hypothetical protein
MRLRSSVDHRTVTEVLTQGLRFANVLSECHSLPSPFSSPTSGSRTPATNSTAYCPRHSVRQNDGLRQSDIAQEELLLNDLVNNQIVQGDRS